MSAPPKSVVKYAGLSDLATAAVRNGGRPNTGSSVFGTPIRFVLPAGMSCDAPSGVLRLLGIKPARDPGQQLCVLIDERARELPLPDGCAVILIAEDHPVVWPDVL